MNNITIEHKKLYLKLLQERIKKETILYRKKELEEIYRLDKKNNTKSHFFHDLCGPKIRVHTKAEQNYLTTKDKFYNKIYIYDHERHTKPKYIIYQETTNLKPYTIKRYRKYKY